MHDTPPLIKAIWDDDMDEVTRLLNRANDPNVKDKDGVSALEHAIDDASVEIIYCAS